MYLLILFLPLLGSLVSGFFGYKVGNKGSSLITTICIGITSILCWFLLINQLKDSTATYINLPLLWINTGTLSINWGFLFDSLTIIMLVFITTVSFLVHLYSIEYMKEDPHFCRFMSYISGFTFFMIVLVTGDNFVQLFLGWEGVGLISYLLINFWYTRIEANKAAIKAMLVNKVGDIGLLIGICFIYYSLNTLDYSTVFNSISLISNQKFNILSYDFYIIDLICFFLFIGCVGKSAQLGLHTWLPDAMEGPTPVSALIHAATMVTAGVFLLIRTSPIFELSSTILSVIVIFGSLTCFISASIALVQNDLKKIIAYSTCSQLGYMVFACGLSNYSVSIYHLANHAFFKALLFLTAGAIIHAINDEQDIRKMGGLLKILPFTYTMILIGSLSLMGFPFLTGFYSKDIILEVAYSKYDFFSQFAFWLGSISALCTAFYSFRLIILVFYKKTNLSKKVLTNIHEAPLLMAIPLGILALGSIYVGYLSRDFFIGLGSTFWNNSILININNSNLIDSEFIPVYIKLIPVVFSIVGALLASFLYTKKEKWMLNLSNYLYNYYKLLINKYYFDTIYNNYLVQPFLKFGYNISYTIIDKGILEILGPYGINNVINRLSNKIVKFQTGIIYNYSFIMLTFIIIYINITIYSPINIPKDIIIYNIIIIIVYLYKKINK